MIARHAIGRMWCRACQQEFSYSNVYKGLPVLNAAAFTAPGLWVLGTAPRVLDIRNPWNLNENVSLSKKFDIRAST